MSTNYEDAPEWEKALRAIVVAGDLGCPGEGLAKVARKALADCGVPYDGPDFAAMKD